MRLLLDECVPRPLLRDLAGPDVHHVVDLGWSSKRNGELLQLMLAQRFEALLTAIKCPLPAERPRIWHHCAYEPQPLRDF
jgi:hypothetical protein